MQHGHVLSHLYELCSTMENSGKIFGGWTKGSIHVGISVVKCLYVVVSRSHTVGTRISLYCATQLHADSY